MAAESTASSPADVPPALRARFEAAGQGHVFRFVDRGAVSRAGAAGLVAQLERVDAALCNELFAATLAAAAAPPPPGALAPPPGVVAASSGAAAWRARGLALLAAGRGAALVLAGGQGTRLGSARPKGEYDIGLPSRKPLFRLLAERLRRVAALAGGAGRPPARVPLYVMTSPMTDADTRAYFSAHACFGLPPEDVVFFCQGTLPCFDEAGKFLLAAPGELAEAPDGNGGLYRAAHGAGVVADLAARGAAGVHVFAVDNAAVAPADPVFLGFCDERGADVGSKACPKAGPHEKVGVLAVRDGAYAVVEYSELDASTAEALDPSTGELAFNAGNICMHFYSTPFLQTACAPAALPKVYHVARKAIPVAREDAGAPGEGAGAGAGAPPATAKGIKLESFIFDVFGAARAMAVLQIERAAEFAPVKNAPGAAEDSPDTARELLFRLHARWLAAAGAAVEAGGGPRAPGGAPAVEVSPLVSVAGEGLRALAGVPLAAPLLVAAEGEGAPPGAGAPVAEAAPAPGVRVVRHEGGLTVAYVTPALDDGAA